LIYLLDMVIVQFAIFWRSEWSAIIHLGATSMGAMAVEDISEPITSARCLYVVQVALTFSSSGDEIYWGLGRKNWT
jgi:hypothetical protein